MGALIAVFPSSSSSVSSPRTVSSSPPLRNHTRRLPSPWKWSRVQNQQLSDCGQKKNTFNPRFQFQIDMDSNLGETTSGGPIPIWDFIVRFSQGLGLDEGQLRNLTYFKSKSLVPYQPIFSVIIQYYPLEILPFPRNKLGNLGEADIVQILFSIHYPTILPAY